MGNKFSFPTPQNSASDFAASYCNSRSEIRFNTLQNTYKATVYFVIVQISDWSTNNFRHPEFAFKFFPNILLDSMFLYHVFVHLLSILFVVKEHVWYCEWNKVGMKFMNTSCILMWSSYVNIFLPGSDTIKYSTHICRHLLFVALLFGWAAHIIIGIVRNR
jgi:hypothetical protein